MYHYFKATAIGNGEAVAYFRVVTKNVHKIKYDARDWADNQDIRDENGKYLLDYEEIDSLPKDIVCTKENVCSKCDIIANDVKWEKDPYLVEICGNNKKIKQCDLCRSRSFGEI